MTAVHEPLLPDTFPGAGEPGFPQVDLTLMQLVIEQAATADAETCTEAELIDQIQQIESLQNSLAALQANRIRAFARAHVSARISAGVVEPEKLERAAVAQIALACRVSPTEGRSRLRVARDLREGLDHVRALFVAGELSRDKVSAIVTATTDLDHDERATIDARLATHDLPRLGTGRLRDLTRRLVAEIAPQKFTARVDAARAQRRVTLRPAPDAMTYLTAYLPVEEGVACLAALRKAFVDVSVDPAPLTRTRGQVMADTLVERVTGKATATDIDLEVQVMVPVEALIDPDSPLPAEIPGHGPIPVDLLATSTGQKALRRLFTRNGIVIGGESRQRFFTGLLAELLKARARHRCTEPYCDAPVRHLDHIDRATDHGPTELDNGRATCEFHNHVREQPGWSVKRTTEGVRTTTPTGHSYLAPEEAAPATLEDRHESQRE
ncbi:HNH endonuclease signature motif containing protein [Pseudonocardia parietis]|uniref:HNH nuclease domain-containing protein n=1 Tax=Pseudonocardia parietis TaxID=570936 RepID=A0ABS4VP35_9PSEU|nr:DUF222 domain-containing protein [Pseudonocardia parietis]MBP2365686.1 hypothetical protein [Pseudonocardia parietis]